MNKQAISIFLFFANSLFVLSLIAQGGNDEQIRIKLSGYPGDSSRIDSLNEWAYNYRNKDISLAMLCADMAGELAVRSGNQEGLALSWYRMALLYRLMGKRDSSLYYYHNSKWKWEAENYIPGVIKSTNALSKVFRISGDYDSALFYAFKSLQVSQEVNDSLNIARSLNRVGIIYEITGDLDEAQKIYQRNLLIYQSIYDNEGIAITLVNLGNIQFQINDYPSAIDYYQQGLAIYEKESLFHKTDGVFMNLGLSYLFSQNDSLALAFLQKSLDIKVAYNKKSGLADVYLNIGKIYENRRDFTKAIDMYKQTIALSEKRGDLNAAESAWYNLYCVYDKQKDYKKALESFINHKRFQDSIFNMGKQELITDYKIRYEVSEKEAQNLLLENRNLQTSLRLKNRTIQRNSLIGGSLSLLAIGIILIWWYRSKAKKDRQIAQQEIVALKKEKDLLAAKYIVEGQEEERKRVALELHDGVGVLLSTAKMQFTTFIRSQLADKPNELINKAYGLIERASSEIRKVSYKMMPGILTHFGLVEALKDLLTQVKDSTGIKPVFMNVGLDERLSDKMEVMIYRVFQELVNNTVKHANANSLSIKIKRTSTEIKLEYSDDGLGFEPDKSMRNRSLGLKNISSRIQFLDGEHRFISSIGKGMVFSAEIPINNN